MQQFKIQDAKCKHDVSRHDKVEIDTTITWMLQTNDCFAF